MLGGVLSVAVKLLNFRSAGDGTFPKIGDFGNVINLHPDVVLSIRVHLRFSIVYSAHAFNTRTTTMSGCGVNGMLY